MKSDEEWSLRELERSTSQALWHCDNVLVSFRVGAPSSFCRRWKRHSRPWKVNSRSDEFWYKNSGHIIWLCWMLLIPSWLRSAGLLVSKTGFTCNMSMAKESTHFADVLQSLACGSATWCNNVQHILHRPPCIIFSVVIIKIVSLNTMDTRWHKCIHPGHCRCENVTYCHVNGFLGFKGHTVTCWLVCFDMLWLCSFVWGPFIACSQDSTRPTLVSSHIQVQAPGMAENESTETLDSEFSMYLT